MNCFFELFVQEGKEGSNFDLTTVQFNSIKKNGESIFFFVYSHQGKEAASTFFLFYYYLQLLERKYKGSHLSDYDLIFFFVYHRVRQQLTWAPPTPMTLFNNKLYWASFSAISPHAPLSCLTWPNNILMYV